jgi:hypothetical protein
MEQGKDETKLNGVCTACKNSFPLSYCKKHFFYCSKILSYLTNGTYNPLDNSNFSEFFTSGYVLKIVDNERPQTYFSFITAPSNLSLKDLDTFLKAFWCYCCSHMSCFINLTTQKQYFPYLYNNSSFPNYVNHDLMSNFSIDDVFNPASSSSSSFPSLIYEYDFSENRTTLFISVVEKIVTTCPKNRFTVLIQNDEPHYCCENCFSESHGFEEKEASIYCSNCCKAYCNNCFKRNNTEHLQQCDSSSFLPIVNSPRVGKCCYQGQSVFSSMDPLNLRFEEFNPANKIMKEEDQDQEGINKQNKGRKKKINTISMETSPTSIHSIHSVSCDDIVSKEVK